MGAEDDLAQERRSHRQLGRPWIARVRSRPRGFLDDLELPTILVEIQKVLELLGYDNATTACVSPLMCQGSKCVEDPRYNQFVALCGQ